VEHPVLQDLLDLVELQAQVGLQDHQELRELPDHQDQVVHQARAVLLDLVVHQVLPDHQVHQVQLEFQQDKFIILMNLLQVESVHIKNYQLVQVEIHNKRFLKQRLVVLQS
jgi:hypothetical protein